MPRSPLLKVFQRLHVCVLFYWFRLEVLWILKTLVTCLTHYPNVIHVTWLLSSKDTRQKYGNQMQIFYDYTRNNNNNNVHFLLTCTISLILMKMAALYILRTSCVSRPHPPLKSPQILRQQDNVETNLQKQKLWPVVMDKPVLVCFCECKESIPYGHILTEVNQ